MDGYDSMECPPGFGAKSKHCDQSMKAAQGLGAAAKVQYSPSIEQLSTQAYHISLGPGPVQYHVTAPNSPMCFTTQPQVLYASPTHPAYPQPQPQIIYTQAAYAQPQPQIFYTQPAVPMPKPNAASSPQQTYQVPQETPISLLPGGKCVVFKKVQPSSPQKPKEALKPTMSARSSVDDNATRDSSSKNTSNQGNHIPKQTNAKITGEGHARTVLPGQLQKCQPGYVKPSPCREAAAPGPCVCTSPTTKVKAGSQERPSNLPCQEGQR